MKRVLSIDFDYFIDTDLDTRTTKFPDGVDEKNEEDLLKDWEYFYNQYPEIKDIGVIKDLDLVNELLGLMSKGKVYIAMSHKDIEKVFDFDDEFNKGESFDIAHIDSHHDMYLGSNPSTLDCSNWLRLVMEKYPHSTVKWIRREDSETSSLLGEYPYESYTDLELSRDYDYIFLCFSPEWTPPHLGDSFDLMCSRVKHLNHSYTY